MRGLTVHPRIRGERQPLSRQYSSAAGSSPHTRGTHDPRRAAWRRCRFIPAYAGNALALHAGTSSAAVHPRIRGERRVCVASCSTTFGSSPHTRGTHQRIHSTAAASRFIPAYAGNASWVQSLNPQASVHPRIRGERPRLQSTGPLVSGSSPHTRGTLRYRSCCSTTGRFIPAYAGNARNPQFAPVQRPVHPRIRGERERYNDSDVLNVGSSPHTRGTPAPTPAHRLPGRFIPAYAGNARAGKVDQIPDSVHPRIRGERVSASRYSHTLFRFIPAYAGNAASPRQP